MLILILNEDERTGNLLWYYLLFKVFESGFYVSSLQSSDNIEIQLLSKSEITSSTSCMALPIFARYYKTGKLLLQ